MANQKDIQEAESKLREVWENPPARNGVFGNALKSLSITNVRGLTASVEFPWPVCAIGGVNGSGKTTILQLCSTAYARAGGRYFRLGDWIRNALAGETPPVGSDATLSFAFWDDTPTLEIPYKASRTRWGYPRRHNPTRYVEFVGISAFAPRIEQRDRVHVFGTQLQVKSTAKLDAKIVQSISRILGVSYVEGSLNTVSTASSKWEDELPQLRRGAALYSEPHMGAGEQKVVRLVSQLELLPKKSLILLEEPETTLHPDAQRGLAWYLMTLARRHGHQILIATHSCEIFQALPPEGRILLVRAGNAVSVYQRAPALQAARELAATVRTNKDLIIVEDEVAARVVAEILRRANRQLAEGAVIIPIGSAVDVRRAVQTFRAQGVRAVGVRDGDQGEDLAGGLLKLPGEYSPERLLISDANVEAASTYIAGLREALARSSVLGLEKSDSEGAKAILAALPHEVLLPADVLIDRLTLAWVETHKGEVAKLAADVETALAAVQPG